MKKKEFILISLLLVGCFWFAPAMAQFDVSLTPLLVEIDLVPGVRKTFSVYLSNENAEKSVNLMAYTMDMTETPEGAYQIAEKGESEFSCADWMQIQDSSIILQPGESKEVRVQIAVPPDVFGGRYAAVVFEVVPDPGPAGQKLGSVQYHFKMPAFVEVSIKRFGGLVRKASISNFKVERVSKAAILKELGGAGLSFTASVMNEGNIHLEGQGTLIIKDENGRTKRRVPLGGGRGVVLPGATVEFKSFLREPAVGEYMARAIINLGGLSPSVAEVPFVVSRTKSAATGSFKASSALAMDIKPDNLEFKIPNRGFRAASFSFRNSERDTIFIKARVAELGYGLEGEVLALDSAETGRSCKDWISIEPAEFFVAPEKSTQVRFTVQVPPEGQAGYYACLVFDALLKDENKDAISSPFEIPVVLSIPPTQEFRGQVFEVEISAVAGKPAMVTAYFRNSGNVHVKPKGRVSLSILKQVQMPDDITYLGKTGYETAAQFNFEEVEQYVLPGEIRRMVAAHPGALARGKYTAEITIDYGGAEPAKLTKEFQLK